ncbi:MAG: hypothetical protein E7032_08135 [Akkermansiaceae bacterium]|nr:hypothetical protein [Akkermansiaceae bacterium]
MALDEKAQDFNYWPSISDMFLVFFIMAMAIVITRVGVDAEGDKFLVDDVIQEYNSLVDMVDERSSGELGHLKYQKSEDDIQLDGNEVRRQQLRRKMAQLLKIIDKEGLLEPLLTEAKIQKIRKQEDGKPLKFTSQLRLPIFMKETGDSWAEYPFTMEHKEDLVASYRSARDKYASAAEASAGFGYDDSLRLLAYRVACMGQSSLAKMDVASMARLVRLAFAELANKQNDTAAMLAGARADVKEKSDKIRQQENELAALKSELQELKARQDTDQRRIAELEKQEEDLEEKLRFAQGKLSTQNVDREALERIRELLEKVPELADKGNLEEAVAKLVQQSIDISNSNLYTDSLQEDDVSFKYNSADPVVHQKGRVKLANLLVAFDSARSSHKPVVYEVIIVGHTDNKGNAERNLELGMERALSIRDTIIAALQKREVITFSSMANICSYGKTYIKFYCYSGSYHNPLVPQMPETECEANRRVEVKLSRADEAKAKSVMEDFASYTGMKPDFSEDFYE